MRDWGEYSKDNILKGTDENGDRLVLEFAKDYKKLTGGDFCISCTRSIGFQLNKFLMYYGMKTNETEYILHNKYNGLTLPGWRNRALSNYKMTEEKALHFITHHPKGKVLFKKLPEDIDKRIEAFKSNADSKTKKKKFNVYSASKAALIAYAKQNNIDLKGVEKAGEIKAIVKDWIEAQKSD